MSALARTTILALVLLFGLVDCTREQHRGFFRVTIPGQCGGFEIRGHRQFGSYQNAVSNWLFPTHAWRLSHSSDSFHRARATSNLGRLPMRQGIPAEDATRRQIEQLFSLQPGALDSYDVYFGDESRISQAILVSKDRTESYYIAAGYI